MSSAPAASAQPREAKAGGYFPALDTMRAIAALGVLTTHVSFWAGAYLTHGSLGTLLARLDVGVAVFFVLSGFLLSRSWLVRAATGREAPSVSTYFWHRFLRIVPLYLFTVLVALLAISDNGDLGWPGHVASLLMLDTVVSDGLPAGLTHMWSLAVEVQFYLVLPLLMLVTIGGARRLIPRRVIMLVLAMVAVSLAWHLFDDQVGRIGTGMPQQWLPAYLSWFAIGIALALLEVQWRESRPIGRVGRAALQLSSQPGSCWGLAAALMLLTATPLAGPSMLVAPTASESTFKHVVYAMVAGLVVLPAVFAPPASRFTRVFTQRLPRHLGEISYGIFCLHLPVLHLVMWLTGYPLFGGHGWQIWLLTLALSLVAAELAHRLIEKPAYRLRRFAPWSRPLRSSGMPR